MDIRFAYVAIGTCVITLAIGLGLVAGMNLPTEEPIVEEPVLSEEEEMIAMLNRMFPQDPNPTVSCQQLFGEEKFQPNSASPQVICESNTIGYHYWSRIRADGVEELMFYTPNATNLTTAVFTTDPGQVIVRVVDANGNVGETSLTIQTNLQPCIPPLCKKVNV